MRIEDIHLLYQYQDWANQRILNQAEQVSAEQFRQPSPFDQESLQQKLLHLLEAEIVWRHLLIEQVIPDFLQIEDFPDVAAFRARWKLESQALWAYLRRLSDEDLETSISYQAGGETRRRVLWHCLVHVVNHGTQHRSECAAMLTGLGCSPGELDFTRFLSAG